MMANENNDLIEKNSMGWISLWATIFFFRKSRATVNPNPVDTAGINNGGATVQNDIEVIEFTSLPKGVGSLPNTY